MYPAIQQPDRIIIDFSNEYNFLVKALTELGILDLDIQDTISEYFKVGFDYNAYENWLDMENMIYIGIRGGFSTFSQTLNSYNIYEPGSYYGENTINSSEKWSGLSASWIEVVSGLKAEVLNNL